MPPTSHEQIQVLHVDDDPNVTNVTATFLESENDRFSVETANSAGKGKDQINDPPPDCIVSGCNLSGTDGLEFLQAVRAEYPNLPFIIYTSKGSESLASDAISAGVTDYLQKGSGSEQHELLADRIENAVANYRSRRVAQQQNERLELLFQESPLGAIQWNEDFRVQRLNEQAKEILGYNEAELRGKSWDTIVGDDNGEQSGNTATKPHVAEGDQHTVNRNVENGGKIRTIEWHNRVVTDVGKPTQSVLSVFQDVTQQQKRETKREEYRTITEALSDPMYVLDEDGEFTYINDEFVTLVGYNRERILGSEPSLIKDKEATKRAEHQLGQLLSSDGPETVTFEVTVEPNEGDPVICEDRMGVLPYDGDQFNGSVGTLRDITDRKERKQELTETNERITAQNQALGSFADIVSDSDRSVNQQITALLELGTAYLNLDIGIVSHIDKPAYTVRNAVAPDNTLTSDDVFDLDNTYCSLVYKGDEPVSFHNPDDGDVKTHPAYRQRGIESYIGVPVDVAGERYGTLNFFQPATRVDPITEGEESFVRILAQWVGAALERQQRQQELERTSEFLEQTQKVANIGGWEVDLQSDKLRWSDELHRIHGISVDASVTPETAIEFYHENDRDTIRDAFDRLTTDGEPYDLELRIITADDELRWVRTRGEPQFKNEEIAYVRGTLQDITERKERQKQLEQSNQIIDNSTDIATIIDPSGTIAYVSPAVNDVLGYSPDELIGTDGFGYQPAETSEAVANAVEHVLTNPVDTKTVQTQFRQADGSMCWIESTLRNRVDDERINGILVSSRDITERRERKEELERQNDRLEEFAGVVSHDIRNPLGIAQGRAAMLEEVTGEEYHEHLRPLGDALDRMEEIITDTLTLARQGQTVGEMSPVSLVDLVGGCWASVETDTASLDITDEFTLQGDSERLRHVFENLFRNAIKHGGDDVTVRIGHTDDGCLYVEDDGPGIPPDEREKVLEAGHTSATGGTGFGLTIVKRVAEAHGWTVSVTEGRSGGARFEFENVTLVDS